MYTSSSWDNTTGTASLALKLLEVMARLESLWQIGKVMPVFPQARLM